MKFKLILYLYNINNHSEFIITNFTLVNFFISTIRLLAHAVEPATTTTSPIERDSERLLVSLWFGPYRVDRDNQWLRNNHLRYTRTQVYVHCKLKLRSKTNDNDYESEGQVQEHYIIYNLSLTSAMKALVHRLESLRDLMLSLNIQALLEGLYNFANDDKNYTKDHVMNYTFVELLSWTYRIRTRCGRHVVDSMSEECALDLMADAWSQQY